jgi:tetratricopeptide (TPR) repeat protein
VGRREEAAAAFERALQYARKAGSASLSARALAFLALARRSQGLLAEARERFEASATLFREIGDAKSESVVLSGLASLDLGEADLDGAKRALESAIDVLLRSGDPATAAMMRVDLGIVLQEMGDLEGARGVYEAALVAHRGAGNRRHEGITLGYLGTLEDEQGRVDAAEVALTDGLSLLRTLGDPKFVAVFAACLAAVCAQRGDALGARSALAEAELRSRDGEARVVAAVALHRLRVEVAAGQRVDTVVERRGTAMGLFNQSDDVRFASRMLDRVLVPIPTPSEIARANALHVAEDASWIESPNGKRINLSRRAVHRRLVQRLVRERLTAPGVPLPLAALVAAGWPGEKLTGSSAQNRLHVALATLRADGLRDHLKREPGGYLLDPAIEVRVER